MRSLSVEHCNWLSDLRKLVIILLCFLKILYVAGKGCFRGLHRMSRPKLPLIWDQPLILTAKSMDLEDKWGNWSRWDFAFLCSVESWTSADRLIDSVRRSHLNARIVHFTSDLCLQVLLSQTSLWTVFGSVLSTNAAKLMQPRLCN